MKTDITEKYISGLKASKKLNSVAWYLPCNEYAIYVIFDEETKELVRAHFCIDDYLKKESKK